MSPLSTFTLTLILTFIFQEYRHYKKPVPEAPRNEISEWTDFIRANISSCYTQQHCFQCQNLITLFTVKFSNKIPPQAFSDIIEKLINRLDSRYKALKAQDEMSDLRIDDLINSK